MKIHATNPTIKSMNLIVPIDGLITIDDKGFAEVSAKCAAALVKGTSDWEFAGGAPKAEKKEDPKSDDDKANENLPADVSTDEVEKEQEQKEKEDEEALKKEDLEAMTVAQLKEWCQEAGLPEAEYKNLKKDLLIAYILKKASE